MKLQGNTLLITGGSAGIGLAFAKRFVELGNDVIVTGRSAERLAAARREQPMLHTIRCDSADPLDIKKLATTIEREHPTMNVLFNNAGIMRFMNLGQAAPDLQELTVELDINLAGPIRTTSALIDTLKQNKGTILNVSSGLAFVPLAAAAIYSATKAALHSYTVSLRHQMANYGIEVIELIPPAVKTDLAPFPEDANVKIITTDELVEATIRGLKSGAPEIRPGQANQLHWMSRIAPKFIAGQLANGSAKMIPPATG